MTARIALALLAIVPAAMAQPWRTTTQQVVLGVAVAVVVLAFAWWRGAFLTTRIARRFAVWQRNRDTSDPKPVAAVSVLLMVDEGAGGVLPLDLLAGHVERYGVRCAKVRVTNLDAAGTRRTYVGLTLRAEDNLAALRARSASLPLYDTAEVLGRRLVDQLRELGFEASITGAAEGPWTPRATETWRGMRDAAGYLVAYEIPVDDHLGDRLAHVWSYTNRGTWSALEFRGSATSLTVSAVCAVRSDEAPGAVPVPGLRVLDGRQKPLLTALDPRSVEPLDVPAVPLPAGLLRRIVWPAGAAREVGAHARG